MHANYLFIGNLRMATCAIHRIESAFVPAVIGANMAVEAIDPAVRALCKVNRVDLVTLATGVFIFGAGHLKHKQQAGNDDCERFAHCNNPRYSCSDL